MLDNLAWLWFWVVWCFGFGAWDFWSAFTTSTNSATSFAFGVVMFVMGIFWAVCLHEEYTCRSFNRATNKINLEK